MNNRNAPATPAWVDDEQELLSTWQSRTLREIVDHLEAQHEEFREALPRLLDCLDRLLKRAADTQEKRKSRETFRQLAALLREDFAAHLNAEEAVIFPRIRKMEAYAQKELDRIPDPRRAARLQSRGHIDSEHYQLIDLFVSIKAKSVLLALGEEGGETAPEATDTLRKFIDTLREHVYLEDRILFPRALEMEKSLPGQR